ncbi:MAG TPA: hypothetical protein PK264_12365, partial [Hyphomicrobiaceae bacterium]|nr:hypothetical protein [Hyphomicrobiaceae bacterium]
MLNRLSLAGAAAAFALMLSAPASQISGALLIGSAEAQQPPRCATAPRRCPTGQTARCQREGRCRQGTRVVNACLQFR